jgi:hypothetical protein
LEGEVGNLVEEHQGVRAILQSNTNGENGLSTVIRSLLKNWAVTIRAHVIRVNAIKSAASKKEGFDGSLRHYYFQEALRQRDLVSYLRQQLPPVKGTYFRKVRK